MKTTWRSYKIVSHVNLNLVFYRFMIEHVGLHWHDLIAKFAIIIHEVMLGYLTY